MASFNPKLENRWVGPAGILIGLLEGEEAHAVAATWQGGVPPGNSKGSPSCLPARSIGYLHHAANGQLQPSLQLARHP